MYGEAFYGFHSAQHQQLSFSQRAEVDKGCVLFNMLNSCVYDVERLLEYILFILMGRTRCDILLQRPSNSAEKGNSTQLITITIAERNDTSLEFRGLEVTNYVLAQ